MEPKYGERSHSIYTTSVEIKHWQDYQVNVDYCTGCM